MINEVVHMSMVGSEDPDPLVFPLPPLWFRLIQSAHLQTPERFTHFSTTTKTLHQMTRRFLRRLFAFTLSLRPISP